MNNLISSDFNNPELKEIGTISISMYQNKCGVSSFKINSEKDELSQLRYVIEDVLRVF